MPIHYRNKLLLIGSCFTEHIGKALGELKLPVLENPHGILFDPHSVCRSLLSYVHDKRYGKDDLFFDKELWHSWEHHGRFSGTDPEDCLRKINQSQEEAGQFLKTASWVLITLGSAFSYELLPGIAAPSVFTADRQAPFGVANCHRVPAQWFNKKLLSIEEITTELLHCLRNCVSSIPHLISCLRLVLSVISAMDC